MVTISRRTAVASGLLIAAGGVIGYGLWPGLDAYEQEVERQRKLIASEPTLTELVRMASLAANGHNSQPWMFHLDTRTISIRPDVSRRTQVVDPDDHHLYVSLGCAAENLVIAAAALGRRPDLAIRPGAETSIDIALAPGPSTGDTLYRAIPHRQSTRSVFDGRPVSSEDIKLLEAAAKEEGVTLLVFTEPSDLNDILEFVVDGNSAQMDDPAFVAELRHWIRFSSSTAIETGDGLFSACSGNPVLPEWAGGMLFEALFTRETENEKYRDHIRSSAGVAVFVGAKEDPEHWIKVGRSFERFALQATALGIRTAHLNQPIEVLSVRPGFSRWLGMPDARPDLVVRFGRAPALPMSLRRSVDAIIM